MNAQTLKAQLDQLSDQLCTQHRTRIHRAIKWLGRAEQETNDDDARFIFLWIAFNAAYAMLFGSEEKEREQQRVFFATLLKNDPKNLTHALLYREFTGLIRNLISNKYLFEPFWRAMREHDSSEQWKVWFDASNKKAMASLMSKDTLETLAIVFERLYVLRNQLIHGGSTWNSMVNRQQVADGAALMGKFVPLMIDIMLKSPEKEFGEIIYPVI